MSTGEWVSVGITAFSAVAVAVAAMAAWRAAASARDAMIRAGAGQWDEARERRIEDLERIYALLADMAIVEEEEVGSVKWRQLCYRLRWADRVLAARVAQSH